LYDTLGNEQKITAKAPLFAENPSGLELYIVPQPLQLTGKSSGYEPKLLHEGLLDYYGIKKADKGVAIILEAKGPMTDMGAQKGTVKIIDQIGNLVAGNIEMEFNPTRTGTVAGVAVWNAKNTKGRTVSAATYLAIVEVEVKFDGKSLSESYVYRKAIMVTLSSK
jgi:hypothetical protein